MARLPKSIRQFVHRRAEGYCEYCGKPEGFSSYDHQVDHIIAVQHGGSNSPDNLALACFRCNNKKGSNIGSLDKATNQLTPLYNPRVEQWDDHFRDDNGFIRGKTATGRVTLTLLDFNEPKQVELRRILITAKRWR